MKHRYYFKPFFDYFVESDNDIEALNKLLKYYCPFLWKIYLEEVRKENTVLDNIVFEKNILKIRFPFAETLLQFEVLKQEIKND